MINETQAQYIARKGLKHYGGNSPYIFISYSHKDWQKVMPVVERLSRDGYRVWFDEGIDPGAEWSKNIATHLKSCKVCLAFVSKNYLESTNCLDELEYARNHVEQRLLIYIEDVKLPDEIDMRHSRIQALHKYNYQKDEDFYGKLYEAPILKACLNSDKDDDTEEGTTNHTNGSQFPVRLVVIAAVILVIIIGAVLLLRGCSESDTDVSEEVIDEAAEGEAEAEEEITEEELSVEDEMPVEDETDSEEELAGEATEEEIVITEAESSEVEQEEEEMEEEETTVAVDVPDDAVEYNGHYYLLYEVGSAIDWEDAKERCEKLGGHLATITSAAEQAFLETNVLDSNGTAWLGGYYDTDGVWRWDTGELMVYTEWEQPSKTSSSAYRYMGICGYDWHYYDETGYYANSNVDKGQVTSYICEWEIDGLDDGEESYGISGAVIPDDAIEYDGHYYRIYQASSDLTWDEAESLCETLGGHLATITSSAEQEYLTRNVLVNGESYFLGAYYNTDGDWVWVTGEVMSYIQWEIPSQTKSSTYRYMGIMSYEWHYYNESGYYENSNVDKDQVSGYLCEWDSEWNSDDENSTGLADDGSAIVIPDDVIEYNGHSYRIYTTSSSMTWEYAESLCESFGGHLLTITSEDEENFLEINVFQDGVNYMIGGYYDTSGNWVWVNGEEMDYMKWELPSQTTSSTYRYLGILSYDWHYFDETGYYANSNIDKGQTTGFICEWDTTADAAAAAEAE